MKRLFIVTGAYGHLGNTLIKKLTAAGEQVRGLVLPGDRSEALDGCEVELVRGNICDYNSLEKLFCGLEGREVIVIHTAGIVTIATKHQEIVHKVNVKGTENIIGKCLEHKVKRLIYISSVHAIPEVPGRGLIREIESFNPANVRGLYAKTKSEASQLVLDSIRKGLDAVIIHPSGIIGPQDYSNGHTTQMFRDYLDGRLTALVNGGYDFVDVRDVADGIIAAIDRAKCGESFILSGRYFSVPQLMSLLSEVSGKRRIRTVLPMVFAKMTAPLSELYYKLLRQKPLYTSYSLYTLVSNSNFSHKKAEAALGYHTRDMRETLKDTVDWLVENERVQFKKRSGNVEGCHKK